MTERITLIAAEWKELPLAERIHYSEQAHLQQLWARNRPQARRDTSVDKLLQHPAQRRRGRARPLPAVIVAPEAISDLQQHRHEASTDALYDILYNRWQHWHAELVGELAQPQDSWTCRRYPPYPRDPALSFFYQLSTQTPPPMLATVLGYKKAMADRERLLPIVDQFFPTHDWKDMFSGIKRTLGVGGDFRRREFTLDLLNGIFDRLEQRGVMKDLAFFRVVSDFWLRGNDALTLTASRIITFFSSDGVQLTQIVLPFGKCDAQAAGQTSVKVTAPGDSSYLQFKDTVPEPAAIFNEAGAAGSTVLDHFRQLLKEILRELGVAEEDLVFYGLHSFRRTGATMASRAGVPDRFIRAFGRWRSFTFARYTEITAEEAAHAVARMYE
jgi:hypothetical protein